MAEELDKILADAYEEMTKITSDEDLMGLMVLVENTVHELYSKTMKIIPDSKKRYMILAVICKTYSGILSTALLDKFQSKTNMQIAIRVMQGFEKLVRILDN